MKEGIPSAPVPQKSNEPEDPGRRAFFKKAGALGVATIAGSLLPEDAEAQSSEKVKSTEIDGIYVEYKGFTLTRHGSTIVETYLKKFVPNAKSVQFDFLEPQQHDFRNPLIRQMVPRNTVQLRISIIDTNGNMIREVSDPVALTRDGSHIEPALVDIFNKLKQKR